MSAIEASSAGVRDMADGSLRITLEFEPRHAREAYSLFGSRGTPVAVVALKVGAPDPAPETEQPKGGPLSRLACQWCRRDDFMSFIRPIYDRAMGGDGGGWGDVRPADVGGPEAYCRHAICVLCDVSQRRLLDHDKDAAETFHRLIRKPFEALVKEAA